MRATRAGVVFLALAVFTAEAGADVGDYLGRPIAAVQLLIEGTPTSNPRLHRLVETKVGTSLSMTAVRETIAHLVAAGAFDDVVVHAQTLESGVALRYELVPAHPIVDIAFVGTGGIPGVSPARLREAVVTRYGASPPASSSSDIARFVEEQFQQNGYLAARVTVRLDIDHRRERATLVLTVEPGERTRIGEVVVVGTPGLTPAAMIEFLELTPGSWYQPEALARRVDAYLADRRRLTRYQARLTITTRFSNQDRVADLAITAVQGPRVRVAFTGDALPEGDPDELVPVAREASASEDLLEDARNRIERELRAMGYRDASAPYLREAADDELVVTFTVRRGPQYIVANVNVVGNDRIPLAELAQALRVQAGAALAGTDLDQDVERIEEFYRTRGFQDVEVEARVTPEDAPAGLATSQVSVDLVVVEHEQTIVRSVRLEGNRSIPSETLTGDLGLQPARPFFATQLALDRDVIQRRYADLGYEGVTVETDPGISEDRARADVRFIVREGRRIFVDHLLIVGNERTNTETIAREVQLAPGDPLGLAAVAETQRRLASLGLFRRTRITELRHGDETTRDVVIAVEEAPVTTLGYGGGVEVGQRIRRTEATGGVAVTRIEFAPRAFFEASRRNLFGKNRSISLFTGVSLRPKDSPYFAEREVAAADDGSGFGFSEYRILGTFREPRVAGTAADAFLTATVEQQIRSSFNFARRAFGAEAAGARGLWRLSANYQIQRTELFDERFNPDERLLVDRLFPQVRLSSFSAAVIRDARDDQLDPRSGHYASVSGQVAARRIGSEVGFVKSYWTAQLFRTLPGTERVVFAGSTRLGLASGFPRRVLRPVPNGDPESLPEVIVVEELPASERFFAGGDTTVRGFALDQLGTADTIDTDGFPIGGNALVILNAEIRAPVFGGLGIVGFFDAGNVFARSGDVDLGELRGAVGFGFRYNSPVGPVRLDVGIKTDRRDVVAGRPERLTAWHVSLGQAF